MTRIAVFGSSLRSSYWNGAATYYRGLLKALAARGFDITFYEPLAFGRPEHYDIAPPSWARSVAYPPTREGLAAAIEDARGARVIAKASGIGVLDNEILGLVAEWPDPTAVRIFWDVDAPATLSALSGDPGHPLHRALPNLDLVLTYSGGEALLKSYAHHGARRTIPVYNALDPDEHVPVAPDPRFAADLAFLGNRLPDREERVAEFFTKPARRMPGRRFLIGGEGWSPHDFPENVRVLGHIGTGDHNAFNASPLAVLNIARDSMADAGYAPATRVFEAAGARACLITDAWAGLEDFLAPDREVLVAKCGEDVVRHLAALTPERARAIGAAARARILAEHTYDRRAALVAEVLRDALALPKSRRIAC